MATRNFEPETLNPRRHVLDVAPLNSVPYTGPLQPDGYFATVAPTAPTAPSKDAEASEKIGPLVIYCPSASKQERDALLARANAGIALTGVAAMRPVGPIVGGVDIGKSEDSYFFRVSLPGVSQDEKDFRCDIEADGTVRIKGVTTTGEKTVCRYSMVFEMQTSILCRPGHFSVTFQLPGPVYNTQFSGSFGTNGVFEGVVKKI